MKTYVLYSFVAALVIAVLATAGCGSTSPHAVSNPQVQKDVATAQHVVQGCIGRGNVLTKTGRRTIMTCIAPPGHGPAFERCVSRLPVSGLARPSKRAQFYQGVTVCMERNR